MYKYLSSLLFLVMIAYSCGSNESQQTEQVSETDLTPSIAPKIEQAVQPLSRSFQDIDQDTSLKISTAEVVGGDVTTTYNTYYQGDKLLKVYRKSESAYGERIDKVYYPRRAHPSLVYTKEIQGLCDNDNNMCFYERENTYGSAGLMASKFRETKYDPIAKPDLDALEYEPNPKPASEAAAIDQQITEEILQEIKTLSFAPARLFKGKYRYFADAANFKPCGRSDQNLDIVSYDLEKAYMSLRNVETYAYVALVATEEMLPNMEEKTVSTLVVKEIIKLDVDKDCGSETK